MSAIVLLAIALMAVSDRAVASPAPASQGGPPPASVQGTVVARQDDRVGVELADGSPVIPVAGDDVDFSTEIGGIAVSGGSGRVVDISEGVVWVRIAEGRPALGMRAVIHATGPPASALAMLEHRQVDGLFEMTLPLHYQWWVTWRSGEAGTWWRADFGTWHVSPNTRVDGPLPDFQVSISDYGPSRRSLVDEAALGREISRRNELAWRDLTERWSGRHTGGTVACLTYSFDAGRDRYWHATCQGGGRSYRINVSKFDRQWRDDDDEAITRMLESFRPVVPGRH